ncbi:MAG: hypothetical protein HY453_00255 [Parcubacteria group bacterium]|nr:hypothetical protein [Parcubacteria group bacterium]
MKRTCFVLNLLFLVLIPHVASASGYLNITARDQSGKNLTPIIYLSGIFKGFPPQLMTLPAGNYSLKLSVINGYTEQFTNPQTITISEGKTLTVDLLYTSTNLGTLNVSAVDTTGKFLGAPFSLAGTSKGSTAQSLSLNSGTYRVSFGTLAGYSLISQKDVDATVLPGIPTSIKATYQILMSFQDVTGPDIVFHSPLPFGTVNQSSILIKGSITDQSRITAFSVNNVSSINIDAGNWECGVNLAYGTNSIAFNAQDEYGNSTVKYLILVYSPPDTTAPLITIDSPSNNTALTTDTAVIKGTISDANAITSFTLNGTLGVLPNGNNWQVTHKLMEGINLLNFRAVDEYNNISEKQLILSYTRPLPPSGNVEAVISDANVTYLVQEDNESNANVKKNDLQWKTANLVSETVLVRQGRLIRFSGYGKSATVSPITAYQWYVMDNGKKIVLSGNASFSSRFLPYINYQSTNAVLTVFFEVRENANTWSYPASITITFKRFVKLYPVFTEHWIASGNRYGDTGEDPKNNTHLKYFGSKINDNFAIDFNYGSDRDDYQRILVCPFKKGQITKADNYSGWGRRVGITPLDDFDQPITDHLGNPFLYMICHCAVVSVSEGDIVFLGNELGTCGATNGKQHINATDNDMKPHVHGALYTVRGDWLVSVAQEPLFLNPSDDEKVVDMLMDKETPYESQNTLKRNPGIIVVDDGAASGLVYDPLYVYFGYNRSRYFSETSVTSSTVEHVWTPTVASSGFYMIEVLIPYLKSDSEKAVYEIFTSEGKIYTAQVNQNLYVNEWVRLKTSDHQFTFYFSKGDKNFVKLTNKTGESGKTLSFDAIRFIQISSSEFGGGNDATGSSTDTRQKNRGGCYMNANVTCDSRNQSESLEDIFENFFALYLPLALLIFTMYIVKKR